MKFTSTTVLLMLASSQYGEAFRQVGTYNMDDFLTGYSNYGGRYLGGGFIPPGNGGQYLYLVADAEKSSTSALWELKLMRNATTGQIIGIDPADTPVAKLVEPYLDHISSNTDSNGKWWYGTVDGYDPDSNCWFNYDDATRSITKEGCNALYDDPAGLWGMGFHPTNGKLFGTGPNRYTEVELNTDNSVLGSTQMCTLAAYYTGGTAFIPSGTYLGSIMTADYDYGTVNILPLNQTTGDCLDDPPNMVEFAPDVPGAWGFFFDPLTNDFFVTTWSGGSFIYHFTGFTPGVDINTVLANIDLLGQELTILISSAYARRELDHEENPEFLRRADGGRKLDPADKSKFSPPGRDKAPGLLNNPGLKKLCEKDEMSMWYYKVNCGFEFSATPEEIAADAVAAFESGDAAAVQEALLGPVEEVFASESFQSDVFSGGDTTEFDANIATVATAIADTATAVIGGLPETTPAEDVVNIKSKFDGILNLISILGNAARGEEDPIE